MTRYMCRDLKESEGCASIFTQSVLVLSKCDKVIPQSFFTDVLQRLFRLSPELCNEYPFA